MPARSDDVGEGTLQIGPAGLSFSIFTYDGLHEGHLVASRDGTEKHAVRTGQALTIKNSPGTVGRLGESRALDRLLLHLQRKGQSWARAERNSDDHDDWDGQLVDCADGSTQQIQIVTADIDEQRWREQAKIPVGDFFSDREIDVEVAVGRLVAAINEKKANKYSPQRRKELWLLLDADQVPEHMDGRVRQRVRAAVKKIDYSQIWVAGVAPDPVEAVWRAK